MALANLRWKIETLGLHNHEVAGAGKLSESKFSRVLAGRASLSASERERIAETLGCLDHGWLFREFTFVPRSYIVHDEPGPGAPIDGVGCQQFPFRRSGEEQELPGLFCDFAKRRSLPVESTSATDPRDLASMAAR